MWTQNSMSPSPREITWWGLLTWTKYLSLVSHIYSLAWHYNHTYKNRTSKVQLDCKIMELIWKWHVVSKKWRHPFKIHKFQNKTTLFHHTLSTISLFLLLNSNCLRRPRSQSSLITYNSQHDRWTVMKHNNPNLISTKLKEQPIMPNHVYI